METTRWTNPSLPQTLQSAVILLYINAALTLLLGRFGLFALVLVAAYAYGGWGIANERKIGYQVAVAVAVAPFVLVAAYAGISALVPTSVNGVLAIAFPVLLLVLLLHPLSRNYQRVWFK